MGTRNDTLVISLGAGAGTIAVLTENGCTFNYAVSGYTATALSNEGCVETKEASTEDLAVVSRTLSVGGGTLTESGSTTITKSGVTCSDTESGTYTQ